MNCRIVTKRHEKRPASNKTYQTGYAFHNDLIASLDVNAMPGRPHDTSCEIVEVDGGLLVRLA